MSRRRRAAAWLPALLVVVAGALAAGAGAAGSPSLVVPGSPASAAIRRAAVRTAAARPFTVRIERRVEGRHPHVERTALRVEGPHRFTWTRSAGASSLVIVVVGRHAVERSTPPLPAGTAPAAAARAGRGRRATVLPVPPPSLASVMAQVRPYLALRLVLRGVAAGSLVLSRSGPDLAFGSPQVRISGTVAERDGHITAMTLATPGNRLAYRYGDAGAP